MFMGNSFLSALINLVWLPRSTQNETSNYGVIFTLKEFAVHMQS